MSSISLVLHTPDSSPDVAPYKLSNKVDHNTFQAEGHISLDAVEPIRAMRWVFNSPLRTAAPPGKILKKVGVVCGLDRCGSGAPTAIPVGTGTFTESFSYSDVNGRPDGDYSISLHAAVESTGWI